MAKEETKAFIEKFEGFEIYYDKEGERFIAEKLDLHLKFEAVRLWELKGQIKDSQIQEINKEGLLPSGYFNKSVAKVRLLTVDKIRKIFKYKILEDTQNSYDVGRIEFGDGIVKLYPMSDSNLAIYNKVKALENEIRQIGEKQRILINKLCFEKDGA